MTRRPVRVAFIGAGPMARLTAARLEAAPRDARPRASLELALHA